MKKLRLTLLLFIATFTLFGQNQSGVIRYLITHNWAKKMAAVEYISKQTRDREMYTMSKRWEWKQYTNLYFTADQSKYEDSEERANDDDEGYSWRQDAYCITRNYTKNTQYDIITALGKVYIVEDSLQPVSWKIHNDLKEVAGHLCMKAYREDTTKMQKIVAWFAMDIPLAAGPERLGGLPGLILEVDINNGGMLITADRIELKTPTPEQFALPQKIKGKKVNEAGYEAVLQKHFAEKRKAEQIPFWGVRY